MKLRLLSLCGLLMMVASVALSQNKVIPLYNGPAPGSETWNWDEATSHDNAWKTDAVYNVSKPSLTLFAPDEKNATGTAVIIAPGGAFHALSINSEGNDVAKWLAKKGITCFVLRYRLAHSKTTDPVAEMTAIWGTPEFNDANKAVIPLEIADGRKAIEYVRSHAAEYHIDPKKIGMIGFSAGGTVTTSMAFGYNAANRPDFIAPIYAYYPAEMMTTVAADAPPIFIVAATDDNLQLAPHSINLYQEWTKAKHPAELHMYQTGGHGFGMRVQHMPSDSWIERFGDWLALNGYLKQEHPAAWLSQNFSPYELEERKIKDDERVNSDWANFARYRKANATLSNTATGKPRVVFMGNSITDGWIRADSTFFAANNYVDRGISGQTTPQMLLRFRSDVIDLKPAAVVILAGINDIAGNTGIITLEETFGNIVSMAQLAKAANIKVVLSSVLPAYDFPWRPGLEPSGKVIKLNTMLKDYAAKNKLVYLDYFTPMKDERNGLQQALTRDGVHPTLDGYKIMEPLAKKAIALALK